MVLIKTVSRNRWYVHVCVGGWAWIVVLVGTWGWSEVLFGEAPATTGILGIRIQSVIHKNMLVFDNLW